jgi:biopolymer transport protein ExbD
MGMGMGSARAVINVTPLIDIVLVVLIIFMVATPVTIQQMPARVPNTETTTRPTVQSAPTVAYRGGLILLDQKPTPESDLPVALRARLADAHDKTVFVDVDDEASYGVALRLFEVARGAGAQTLAFTPENARR